MLTSICKYYKYCFKAKGLTNSPPSAADFNYYLDTNKEDQLFTIYCANCNLSTTYLSITINDLTSFPPGFFFNGY